MIPAHAFSLVAPPSVFASIPAAEKKNSYFCLSRQLNYIPVIVKKVAVKKTSETPSTSVCHS